MREGETDGQTDRNGRIVNFNLSNLILRFCKRKDSASTLIIVFFQNALPAKKVRMNGPVFPSVLNRSMKVNCTEEKGSKGGRWQLKKMSIY